MARKPYSDPHVGQSVLYVARGSADGVFPPVDRAAIITELHRTPASDVPREAQLGDKRTEAGYIDLDHVGLAVLNPTGLFFHEAAYDDRESPAPGSWHFNPNT